VAAYLQWILSIALSPLVVGLLQWARARLQARQGPSPLQPYRDLWKLARKRPTWPETASLVFGVAPYLNFVTYVLLTGLISGAFVSPNHAGTDLLTIVFLLALAKFVTALAAFDTGSPLTALGGSRAMFFHVLAEPALVALAYAHTLQQPSSAAPEFLRFLPHLLIGAGLLGVLLLETGRLPFDNAETRLELTMIESAVTLEYGGLELAMWEWAGSIRLTFFFTLIIYSFDPSIVAGFSGLAVLLRLVVYLAFILGLAVWETTRPKYRLRAILGSAVFPLMLALSAILFDFINNFLR